MVHGVCKNTRRVANNDNNIYRSETKILDLVNNCDLLTKLNKKDMISYLNDFFDRIEDEGFVRRTFINYARY